VKALGIAAREQLPLFVGRGTAERVLLCGGR
jgi:hypothetical protein